MLKLVCILKLRLSSWEQSEVLRQTQFSFGFSCAFVKQNQSNPCSLAHGGFHVAADCKTSALPGFFNYPSKISSQCFESHTQAERYILVAKEKPPWLPLTPTFVSELQFPYQVKTVGGSTVATPEMQRPTEMKVWTQHRVALNNRNWKSCDSCCTF